MLKLIKQLNSNEHLQINEDGDGGAVGAGSVASAGMPLFASLVKRSIPTHPRVIKYKNETNTNRKPTKKKGLGISEKFHTMYEDIAAQGATQTYDTSEAISKLKALEDKESVDYRDTSTFGLVDVNGDIVRVTIPADQAQGFEQDLQHFLGDQEDNGDAPEIAEVLFKLKDRYTIVNVDWPAVEEDQEEGQEIEGVPGEEGMPPGEEGMPAEGDLPPEEGMPPAGGADTNQVTDLLTQVIDMMKADADARKSEAQAREAEAKTKQAEAARHQAMARVKQEEQFLDMDEYQKAQKAKEKEAKRLAQLAKWKHGMENGEEDLPAQDPQYDFLPGEEEEEIFRRPQQLSAQPKSQPIRGKVSSSDIAKYITQRTR